MARPRTSFAIQINGLDGLERTAGDVGVRQRRFLDRTVTELASNIADKAPGGPTRSVGRSIYHKVLTDTVAAVGSNHPGAKALDRGAYIAPRPGRKAIKFEVDGQDVFATFVRLPARRYFARGLRTRNQVAAREWERAMSSL